MQKNHIVILAVGALVAVYVYQQEVADPLSPRSTQLNAIYTAAGIAAIAVGALAFLGV